MSNKRDNVCIVTGGNSGIGLSISKYLLKKNYKVVILDKKIDTAIKHFDRDLKEKNILILKTDITNSKEVFDSVNKVIEYFGTVSVLVNNAGIDFIKQFLDEIEEEWDRVMDVNLKGVFLCCKAVIPKMIKNKFGRIVNISSISGLKSSVYSCSAYCASKAGVIGFSRCLASQVAKYNVRVNCIAPCTTETAMISSLDKKTKEEYIKSVPLGRIATPMDINHAVYFLISDYSDFITGETININGGLFMK